MSIAPRADAGERHATELTPLGLAPAIVTGTSLTSRQGNADGFSTMPSSIWLETEREARALSAREMTSPSPSGNQIDPLPSALVEAGRPLGGGGPLYAARNPGGAEIYSGEQASIAMPDGIFGHADRAARVTVEARLADGSPLPPWISLNPETGRVVVTPPARLTGVLEIRLTARDSSGHAAWATYTIVIRDRQAELQPHVDALTLDAGRGGPADPLEILTLFSNAATGAAHIDASSLSAPHTSGQGRMGFSHMVALAALERCPNSLI